jgi:hypothetical protein
VENASQAMKVKRAYGSTSAELHLSEGERFLVLPEANFSRASVLIVQDLGSWLLLKSYGYVCSLYTDRELIIPDGCGVKHSFPGLHNSPYSHNDYATISSIDNRGSRRRSISGKLNKPKLYMSQFCDTVLTPIVKMSGPLSLREKPYGLFNQRTFHHFTPVVPMPRVDLVEVQMSLIPLMKGTVSGFRADSCIRILVRQPDWEFSDCVKIPVCAPIHDGQLKLFVYLLRAVRKFQPSSVLYIGAAPGYNILAIARVYPKIIFYLVDPLPIKSSLTNVKYYKALFTGSYQFMQNKVPDLFVSDIRPDGLPPSGVERDNLIHDETILQVKWATEAIQRGTSYCILKFRVHKEIEIPHFYDLWKQPFARFEDRYDGFLGSQESRLVMSSNSVVTRIFDYNAYALEMQAWNKFRESEGDFYLAAISLSSSCMATSLFNPSHKVRSCDYLILSLDSTIQDIVMVQISHHRTFGSEMFSFTLFGFLMFYGTKVEKSPSLSQYVYQPIILQKYDHSCTLGDDIYTSLSVWVKHVAGSLKNDLRIHRDIYYAWRSAHVLVYNLCSGRPSIDHADLEVSGHLFTIVLGYFRGLPISPASYMYTLYDITILKRRIDDPLLLVEYRGTPHPQHELLNTVKALRSILYFKDLPQSWLTHASVDVLDWIEDYIRSRLG